MGKTVFLCLCVFVVGCSSVQRHKWELVGSAEEFLIDSGFDFTPDSVTCSFQGGNIEDVVEMLPEGVSVVWDESLLSIPIFAELRKVTYAEFFAVVSRSLNCDVYKIGSVWVFGKPVKQTEGAETAVKGVVGGSEYCFFFKLSGLEHEKVVSYLGGKVTYMGGSTFMFKGSVKDAVEVHKVSEVLKRSLPSEYVFDLHFVSDDLLQDFSVLGGDTTGTLNLSYMIAKNSPSVVDWSLVLANAYDVTLTRSASNGIRSISGVFREDRPFSMTIGDSIPFVKKNILENGTIVDSAIEYQDIGIGLTIGCQGQTKGVVNVRLNVQDASSYVSNYPVKHGSTIETSFTVSSSEVHYVGSFYSDVSQSRILGFKRNSSRFYVLCRVVRVSPNQRVFLKKTEKSQKKILKRLE